MMGSYSERALEGEAARLCMRIYREELAAQKLPVSGLVGIVEAATEATARRCGVDYYQVAATLRESYLQEGP